GAPGDSLRCRGCRRRRNTAARPASGPTYRRAPAFRLRTRSRSPTSRRALERSSRVSWDHSKRVAEPRAFVTEIHAQLAVWGAVATAAQAQSDGVPESAQPGVLPDVRIDRAPLGVQLDFGQAGAGDPVHAPAA